MPDIRAIADEIVRIHKFFEDMFNGVGERSIVEFSNPLDAAFSVVSPSGNLSSSEEIFAQVNCSSMGSLVEIQYDPPRKGIQISPCSLRERMQY